MELDDEDYELLGYGDINSQNTKKIKQRQTTKNTPHTKHASLYTLIDLLRMKLRLKNPTITKEQLHSTLRYLKALTKLDKEKRKHGTTNTTKINTE